MPERLHLIRHPQTNRNAAPTTIGGRSNHDELSELGVKQASAVTAKLLEVFADKPVSLWSSPAVRTLHLADALVAAGLSEGYAVDDRLQELSMGEWEGRLREDVYTPPIVDEITRQGKNHRPPSGESMIDLGVRLHEVITERIIPESTNPDIVVVTHGFSIKGLVDSVYDFGLTHEEFRTIPIPNCSITDFGYELGVLSVGDVGKRLVDWIE